jgi:hypothetical protein
MSPKEQRVLSGAGGGAILGALAGSTALGAAAGAGAGLLGGFIYDKYDQTQKSRQAAMAPTSYNSASPRQESTNISPQKVTSQETSPPCTNVM